MHGRGACVAGGMHGGGACMAGCVCGGGWEHVWQEKRQLQRAVRILLECILVCEYVHTEMGSPAICCEKDTVDKLFVYNNPLILPYT